uniref:Peptidase C2 calpain domain-containing protein n=1 Tax=Romanomermis culicivorax TaxID=13658 RepID=A0A915KAX3_ROMCU
MTWEDFCTYFTDVSVCHQINTSFFTLGKRYIETIFHGIWMNSESRGDLSDRAGGCANFKESCLCNPQYRIDVPDDDSEIIVSLMQRDIRERRRQGVSYLTIGIMVERVEENRTFRMHQLLDMQATSDYISTRSVYLRMVGIRRGRYVIVPTTYAPGEEGEFMMRVYSAQQLNASELTRDKPSVGLLPCCRKQFTCVTRLRLIGGEQIMASNSQNAGNR